MVLFSPLGDRVLAKPMKYASLARLTLSLVSCNWSSGSSCKSCIECPGLQKCSAILGWFLYFSVAMTIGADWHFFQGWLQLYEGPVVRRGQAFSRCGHLASLISRIKRMYTNLRGH